MERRNPADFKKLPAQDLLWPFQQVKPFHHQKVCATLSVFYPQFLFALDTGLGKTIIALATFEIYRKLNLAKKALVILPFSEYVLRSWEEQIKDHQLPFSISLVSGSAKQKDQILFAGDSDITLVSSKSLLNFFKRHFITKLPPDREVLDYARAKAWVRKFQFLVIDECHFLQNPTSKSFRYFYSIFAYKETVPFRFLLSATPGGDWWFGAWCLYKILDHGETFFSSYSKFLNYFFVNVSRGKFPIWRMRRERKQEFFDRFWSKAIYFSKNECLDLPPKHKIKLTVDLLKEQEAAYIDALQETPLNVNKLRRIASGIVDGQFFLNAPKVEALLALTQDVVNGSGHIIIWHWLTDEGQLITTALKKHFSPSLIGEARSEIPDRDKQRYIANWHKGKVKILVANPASLGQVVTLTEARQAVYFSNPDSWLLRKQSEDRIYRIGQAETCFYFDLVSRGTVDEVVHRRLQQKQDFYSDMTQEQVRKELLSAFAL